MIWGGLAAVEEFFFSASAWVVAGRVRRCGIYRGQSGERGETVMDGMGLERACVRA